MVGVVRGWVGVVWLGLYEARALALRAHRTDCSASELAARLLMAIEACWYGRE